MFDHYNYSADDEAERKKKKKIKSVGEQVKLAPGSHLGYGFERVDRVKKTTAVFKQTTGIAQPERIDTSKENVIVDLKEVYTLVCFQSFLALLI